MGEAIWFSGVFFSVVLGSISQGDPGFAGNRVGILMNTSSGLISSFFSITGLAGDFCLILNLPMLMYKTESRTLRESMKN